MSNYLDRFRDSVLLDRHGLDLVPFIGSLVALDAPQFVGVFKLEAFGINPINGNINLYGASLGEPIELMAHQLLYVDCRNPSPNSIADE